MSRGYVRIIKWAYDYLKEPKTTSQICDYIKKKSKHGTRVQSLGNILSYNRDKFIKLGKVKRASNSIYKSAYSYEVLWGRIEGV